MTKSLMNVLLLSFCISVPSFANAGTCGRILRTFALDAARIASVDNFIPVKYKQDLYTAVTEANREELDGVIRYYDRYLKYVAAPVGFAAVVGYVVSKVTVTGYFPDHYSSMILLPALLNVGFVGATREFPVERKRILVNAILFSIALHGYWELGAIDYWWERMPPQVNRAGTDWGDLTAGVGSSLLYYPFMRMVDFIRAKRVDRQTASD